MGFQTRLFLPFLTAVFASVILVASGFIYCTTAAIEEADAERTKAVFSQFKKEYDQRVDEVLGQVNDIAESSVTLHMAIDLARPNAGQSIYFNDAKGASQDHNLDFLQFVGADGTLISSLQNPMRVGYKETWVTARKDWEHSPPFLRQEELPSGVQLSITAVRPVSRGNYKMLYVVGGRRLDQRFLSLLVLPSGTRALLYRNLDERTFLPANLTGTNGAVDQAQRFAPLINQIQASRQPAVETIEWTSDAASAETFHLIPLFGRNNELSAVLLVGNSRREVVLLRRRISRIAARSAAAAILTGLLIGLCVSLRITQPR
ncbi:MAG: hypothetical protein C5B58_15540 [Acidobacteria bacterium]|nr:MAG: hypothetical protein C5B58_15540 [Acidobacteriota bacterium]